MAGVTRSSSALPLAAVLLLMSSPAAAREKVDVIFLKNGDRLTGEIISLEYGMLSVKTDSMSTVSIEWPDVVSVDSKQLFILEDLSGGRYYGALTTDAQNKQLNVVEHGGEQSLQLHFLDVTRISPGEETFWSRMQGSFSVGFDYAKSTDITTLNGAMDLSYRAPDFAWALSASVNTTKDPTQGTLDRDSVTYGYQWLRPHKRFWTGVTSLERNEETGIEARLTLGGGVGQYFIQTSRSELSGLVGLALTKEWATGVDDSQQSLEGLIGGTWRIFKFNTPKVSLNASVVVYPSITESGRYRTSSNFTVRREIVSDFYLDLNFYQTYDTDPPDENAEKDDYGITTSLGYSFY